MINVISVQQLQWNADHVILAYQLKSGILIIMSFLCALTLQECLVDN